MTIDSLNEEFHADYDVATEGAARRAPVLVLVADALILFRGDDRSEHPFTPAEFHLIKSAAHAPVALYAILLRGDGRAPLVRLRGAIDTFGEMAPSAAADDTRAVLRTTRAFLDEALAPDEISAAKVEAFARAIGPSLLRLTEHATRMQLTALDAAVEVCLASLDEGERRGLQVVVTGEHQARARSLGMQYFQQRFGEAPGQETRVTYGEGIDDADQAVALVGKRRVDRAIAAAFFGDEKRLQRDVLADAATALLATTPLTPI
jgi:hypothetical protein